MNDEPVPLPPMPRYADPRGVRALDALLVAAGLAVVLAVAVLILALT